MPDLPVWTIRPNWKDGITERLDWLTDILASTTGAEQRRMVRLSPRRSFEMTFNPVGRDRTLLDLYMHRMGTEEWLIPLWHDKAKLDTAANSGAVSVSVDTRWREFREGDFAILYKDAWTYEVVEIFVVADGALTFTSALNNNWKKGSAIYPLRQARIQADNQSVKALTGTVGEAQVLFNLSLANDFTGSFAGMVTYQGRPVITIPPNRSESLDLAFARNLYLRDSQMGLVYQRDDAERPFTTQAHNWMAEGREARWKLRQMLYALGGRQKSIWMPTFNDDVILSRAATMGNNYIDIQAIGWTYTGGVSSGREFIRIGGEIVRVIGVGSPLAAGEERLMLSAPLGSGKPLGASGSFLDTARQDNDTIEITHHVDADGVMEVTSAFRTFKDSRSTPSPIYLPIPTAEESIIPCGTPGDEVNPCNPVFPGWYLRLWVMCDTGPLRDPNAMPYNLVSWQPYKPHPNRGKTLGGWANSNGYPYGSIKEYGTEEFPDPIQPELRGQTLVDWQGGPKGWLMTIYDPVPAEIGAVHIKLMMQYGAFTFGYDGDTLWWMYQWWNTLPSPKHNLGWIGSLWPVRYEWDIPRDDLA